MKRIPDVTFWHDERLSGFEICRVVDSRHVFPNHAHDGMYAVGMMEKGGSYCLGPQRTDAFVPPGGVALINPGQVHSGVPAADLAVTYRMLYIDAARMMDTASDVCEQDGSLPVFTQVVIRDAELQRRLVRVSRLIIGSENRLKTESAFTEAVARLVSGYGGLRAPMHRIGHERTIVRRAREFLSEHLDENVSLAAAAEAVGLSRYHFLRVFKETTGLPPHAFRTQRRIDRARQLIRRGVPFVDVALATGFSDQSHFTNTFRQVMGATPRQYAANPVPGRSR